MSKKISPVTVVVVRSGSKRKSGEIQPLSMEVGGKVLLPECGGTKVVLDDKDYYLIIINNAGKVCRLK